MYLLHYTYILSSPFHLNHQKIHSEHRLGRTLIKDSSTQKTLERRLLQPSKVRTHLVQYLTHSAQESLVQNGGPVACVSRDSIVGERAASTLQIPSSIADKGNSIPLAFLCAVRDFSYVRERPIQPSGLLDRAMREANLFDYSRNGEPSAFYSTGDSRECAYLNSSGSKYPQNHYSTSSSGQ